MSMRLTGTAATMQCLHNQSGNNGVLDVKLFEFTFPLVYYCKVLCSANEKT